MFAKLPTSVSSFSKSIPYLKLNSATPTSCYEHLRKTRKCFRAATARMSSDVFSDNDNNWRGVPLSEIYGSQSPWGSPEFPLVTPGYNHVVLYHVPGCGLATDRPPKPQIGHDKWDQEHVRMPCSSHSLYPVEDSNGESHLKKRWEIIEAALCRPIRNSKELADAILSYNTKFKGIWKFQSMHKLFDEYLEEEESQYFFDVTLPEIAKLALALPKLIQSPIPLLKQHKNSSVSLSQQQIASLLANAFFCTFPRRNTTKRTSEYASYPFINFNSTAGVGVVTFSRRSVPPRAAPVWHASDISIASLPLHVDPENTIEDAHGLIQVDFANKFLGGGVLNHGCVQEEIRFVICPELLISMLFTEVLRPNEALLIIGSERYSKYSGYGHSFHWTGDFTDCTPLDSSHRRRCAVLAIDALPYTSVTQEYRREMIIRELNKAWVGFSFSTEPQPTGLNYPGVATGNWGCGAFGGTPQLKCLIQMMACAAARRPMAYYTFNDYEIRDEVIGAYHLLTRYNVTVGQLYKYIVRFSTTDVRYSQLHAYLHQALRDDEAKTSDEHKTPEQNEPENMDVSTASDTSALDLPLSSPPLQEITKDSPDLFSTDSQEEINENLTEVKVQKDPPTVNAASKENMEKTETVRHPSRLFEEMQKLDEQSGKLNLSVPSTSPFKPNNVHVDESNTSVDSHGTSQLDATLELKKRVSRKITDYFSKKSI